MSQQLLLSGQNLRMVVSTVPGFYTSLFASTSCLSCLLYFYLLFFTPVPNHLFVLHSDMLLGAYLYLQCCSKQSLQTCFCLSLFPFFSFSLFAFRLFSIFPPNLRYTFRAGLGNCSSHGKGRRPFVSSSWPCGRWISFLDTP
ncbi:hypothetical protein BDV32DRAFT_34147 [Aspergillus pseudonomiae]|nr:hypothetical protein BDV32DRAFT_34147 [Aspergillus pseudonomiae]